MRTLSHGRISTDALIYWHELFSVERLRDFGLRTGPYIVGPVDLAPVLRMRQELQLKKLPLSPVSSTDLFLLGEGEPDVNPSTKIGGVPYRASHKPWPQDDEGEDFQFLCQFDFRESRDLVGDTPGDLLLIYTTEGLPIAPGSEKGQLFCEWGDSDLSDPLKTIKPEWLNDDVVKCFGAPVRLLEYDPFPVDVVSEVFLDWKMDMYADDATSWAHFGARPLGMKIGGLPICMSRQEISDRQFKKYLCSLTTVYSKSDALYPWLNRETSQDSDKSLGIGRRLFLGDNLELNIFLNDVGETECVMSSTAAAQRGEWTE